MIENATISPAVKYADKLLTACRAIRATRFTCGTCREGNCVAYDALTRLEKVLAKIDAIDTGE